MKITIIGGGNMGGATARGLAQGAVAPENITVSDPSQTTLDSITGFCDKIQTASDNAAAARNADIVIVAVKPWLVEKVLEGILPALDLSRQLLVMIAAGVDFAHIRSYIHNDSCPLFRIIPNTAIAIRESLTLMSVDKAQPEQTALIKNLFDNLGHTVLIEERLMTEGTAVTSCGIAYAFQYIKAAMQGAIELGFYPKTAQEMIDQTIIGAIRLMEANHSIPDEEIYKVCTPGGVTIKGLNEMAAKGFDDAVISGLKKAAGR